MGLALLLVFLPVYKISIYCTHIYDSVFIVLILLSFSVQIDPFSPTVSIYLHVKVFFILLIFLAPRRLFENIFHLLFISVNQSALSVFNVTFPVDVELIVALQVFAKALLEAIWCVAAVWYEDVVASLRVDPLEVESLSHILQLFLIFFMGLFPEPVTSLEIVVVVAIRDWNACSGAVLTEAIDFAAFKLACVFAHRFISLRLAFDGDFLVHVDD